MLDRSKDLSQSNEKWCINKASIFNFACFIWFIVRITRAVIDRSFGVSIYRLEISRYIDNLLKNVWNTTFMHPYYCFMLFFSCEWFNYETSSPFDLLKLAASMIWLICCFTSMVNIIMRSSRDSYALVIYWFFGYLMSSYTFAFWELFLNIDKDQWYLSKCDYK